MEPEELCDNCKTCEEGIYWSHFMPVHFCLVLGADGDYRRSIALPQKFSENMKSRVPDKVTLQGPSGATFQVKFSHSMTTDNTLSLTDGWEEFVKSYSLKEKDILVCTYEYAGTAHLSVLIFRGDTHCEKESAYFFSKCGHDSQDNRKRRVSGVTSSVVHNTDHADDECVNDSVPAATEDAACQTPSVMHGAELRCYGRNRKRKKHSAGKSLSVKAKSAKTKLLNTLSSAETDNSTDQDEPSNNECSMEAQQTINKKDNQNRTIESSPPDLVASSKGRSIKDVGFNQGTATSKKSSAKKVGSGKGRGRPRKQPTPITEMENLTNQGDPSNNKSSLNAQQNIYQEEVGNCQVGTSPVLVLASSLRGCPKINVASNPSNPSTAPAKKAPAREAAALDNSTNNDEQYDSERTVETQQNPNQEEKDGNGPAESSPPIVASSSKAVSSRGRPIKYVSFKGSIVAAKKSPGTSGGSVKGSGSGRPQKRSTPTNEGLSTAVVMAFKEADALSFVRIMKPSSVQRRFLVTIPNEWFRKNLPRETQQVTLILGEKKWIATLSYSPSSITGTICAGGWKQFAFENQLEVNDVCLFKLTSQEGEPLVFKVRIFRAARAANSSPAIASSPL